MSVYSKLSKVQSDLKAPKGQYNSFGKYKYRSCEDIVESVKPLLAKNGLVMTITDELTLIGDRYYIKSTVTVIDVNEGDRHEVDAYAREANSKKGMDDSQLTGSTSSYARKYALNGMFAIDDTKNSDSTNTHGKDEDDTITNQTITNQTKEKIEKLTDKAHKRYEEAKGEIDKSKLKGKLYEDFAKEKGWKKFFISGSTQESMAKQFVRYLEGRLGVD